MDVFKWKKMSFEFGECGTEWGGLAVNNPVCERFKLIYDIENGIFHVFHPLGKGAIPLFRSEFGRFSVQGCMRIAERTCVENEDGSVECWAGMFSDRSFKSVREALDIQKSRVKYAIETGLEAWEVPEREVHMKCG